jgi:hypothetical protein
MLAAQVVFALYNDALIAGRVLCQMEERTTVGTLFHWLEFHPGSGYMAPKEIITAHVIFGERFAYDLLLE